MAWEGPPFKWARRASWTPINQQQCRALGPGPIELASWPIWVSTSCRRAARTNAAPSRNVVAAAMLARPTSGQAPPGPWRQDNGAGLAGGRHLGGARARRPSGPSRRQPGEPGRAHVKPPCPLMLMSSFSWAPSALASRFKGPCPLGVRAAQRKHNECFLSLPHARPLVCPCRQVFALRRDSRPGSGGSN